MTIRHRADSESRHFDTIDSEHTHSHPAHPYHAHAHDRVPSPHPPPHKHNSFNRTLLHFSRPTVWLALLTIWIFCNTSYLLTDFTVRSFIPILASSFASSSGIDENGQPRVYTNNLIIVPNLSDLWSKVDSKEKRNMDSLVYRPSGRSAGGPEVVLVVSLNPETYSTTYMQKVLDNRRAYATRHGYGLYIRYSTDFRPEYESAHDPSYNPVKKTTWTWSKLAIMKAALRAYPTAKHFWYLHSDAFVIELETDLVASLIEPEALAPKMMRGRDVIIQGKSTAQSYLHTQASDVKLIATQDWAGISGTSFILANTDKDNRQFAHSLLDFWNDPLYKAYPNFGTKENSAINHILTWHAVFLSKTAIVGARELAPYTGHSLLKEQSGWEVKEYERLAYKTDDFILVLKQCEIASSADCLVQLDKVSG